VLKELRDNEEMMKCDQTLYIMTNCRADMYTNAGKMLLNVRLEVNLNRGRYYVIAYNAKAIKP